MENRVVIRQVLSLPDEMTFRKELEAVNRFQQIVHANLIKDQDYGTIPGTPKPTLLKPGAEKIAKLLGLADHYTIVDQKEDWDKPFFRYLIRCSLVNVQENTTTSEGLGECNSMETKYRWRDAKKKCPACGVETIIKGQDKYGGGWLCFKKVGGCGAKYNDGDPRIEEQASGRVANDAIYDQVNTILKMAKKRALVDAALSAGRLSNIFTQDLEDIQPMENQTKSTTITFPRPASTTPDSATKQGTEAQQGGEPTEPGESAVTAVNHEPHKSFKNIGELLTACLAIRTEDLPAGVAKGVAMNIWGITKDTELPKLNLEDAWAKIQEHIK